jgi:hypothetical protein
MPPATPCSPSSKASEVIPIAGPARPLASRGPRPPSRHNAGIGIIAVADHRAQGEDGFGAVEAPSGSGDAESVADDVPACSLDDAGGDGPARGQGLVVAQVLVLAGQVAHARIRAGPLGGGKSCGFRFGGDLGGDPGAVSGQYRERLDRDPVLGGRISGGVQGPRGLLQILKDVHEVDEDAGRDAAAGGLGADQVELVLGTVHEDHPRPLVARVAGSGLAERGGDHVRGVVPDRPGQPFGCRFGPGPQRATAVPAAGRGDDVVRAARGRLGVVDADQGGHPLAVRFLSGGQPGPHPALPGGGFGGGRAQRFGPHRDPLGVGGDHQQRRGGARHRDAGGVERGDIGRGVHHRLLGLPFADHRAAAAGDRGVRGLERAAGGLHRGQPGQGVGRTAGRQRQRGIGRVEVARPGAAPGTPGHLHRAEQRGQQPAVAGLHPGSRDPVRARRGGVVLPGSLLLPCRPQVQVILQ